MVSRRRGSRRGRSGSGLAKELPAPDWIQTLNETQGSDVRSSTDPPPPSRSSLRLAVFVILLIHAVFFAGLLVVGSRRSRPNISQEAAPATDTQRLHGTKHSERTAREGPGQTSVAAETSRLSRAWKGNVAPSVKPSPASSQQIKEYTISPGDTLFKIARANGVSVDALMRANLSANPVRLRPGQRIQIPPAQGRLPGTPTSGPGKSGDGGEIWYVVKAGDTLTRLASSTTPRSRRCRRLINLTQPASWWGKNESPSNRAVWQPRRVSKSALKLTRTDPAQSQRRPARECDRAHRQFRGLWYRGCQSGESPYQFSGESRITRVILRRVAPKNLWH